MVGFGIDRRVQDTMHAITTIPGAAGAFRRQAVLDVGGLSLDTLAEDTDLTIALGREGWRVVYEERAVAWTEAPTTVSQLWRQRYRWTYGTMQAVWKHRRSLRERGASGRTGWLGLGHIGVFQVLFPLAAPLVDIFFVYGLLFGDPATTLVLWVSMLAIQTTAAAYAFRLDGEPLGPLWVAPLQQLRLPPADVRGAGALPALGGHRRPGALAADAAARGAAGTDAGSGGAARGRARRLRRKRSVDACSQWQERPVVGPGGTGPRELRRRPARGARRRGRALPSRGPTVGACAAAGSTCCGRSPWSASSATTAWAGAGCRSSSPRWA